MKMLISLALLASLAAPARAEALHPKIGAARIRKDTQKFYGQWKEKYFKLGPKPGEAYVYINADGQAEAGAGGTAAQTSAISEGQGYGMLLLALLGEEPSARLDFDALYAYCQHHPCPQSPYLMSWDQVRGGKESTAKSERSSATDGDLDIAYALLLADARWGSPIFARTPSGWGFSAFTYKGEALHRIEAIWSFDFNPETHLPGLGSFIDKDEPDLYYGVRPSDLMTGHFAAFARASGDSRWTEARTRSLALLRKVQKRFSPKAGLFPDFLIVRGRKVRVAPPNYLENTTDGSYGYNACRVPWRLAVDELCNGGPAIPGLLVKLDDWIQDKCEGKAENIVDGYRLNGSVSKKKGTNSQAFVAPFALAAIFSDDQDWLDETYAQVTDEADLADEDYFGNTIKALCLAAFSGRWAELDGRIQR
jgi:hypothetical protein